LRLDWRFLSHWLSNHEFETAKEAEEWRIAVMLEHDYRGLGMSDAEEA